MGAVLAVGWHVRGWIFAAAIALLAVHVTAQGTAPATPAPAPSPAKSAAPTPPRLLNLPSGANVAIIRIEGEIDSFTPTGVRLRTERALDGGASIIVYELHTPGGEIYSAMDTAKFIKTVPVPTIAWVNQQAYSAGALLATACDEVVVNGTSVIGDAAPISLFGDLAPTERAKILSPWLAEFRDNAQQNGYDYTLLEAMCVLGIEVYEIHNPTTGETAYVNQADLAVMVHGEPLSGILKSVSRTPGQPVADEQLLSATIETATEQDRGQWELIRQVHNGQQLLTLTGQDAVKLGLADATISSEADLSQALGAGAMLRIPLTVAEAVSRFLTQLWVRALLVVVVLVFGYLELSAPGLSVPGLIAGLALLALVGAPFILGLAEAWHLILLGVGLLMLVVEIFFTPTFGLLGILGLFCMFLGVVLMVIPTGGGPSFGPIQLPPGHAWPRFLASMLATLIGLIGGGVGFYLITRHFGRVPGLNRMILASEAPGEWDPEMTLAPPMEHRAPAAVGETGVALAGLRPGGQVEIGDRIVDVVSTTWIERGQAVRVAAVEGSRVIVEPVDA